MKKLNKKPTPYKHLFFDLDNTLWDFTFDSKNTFNKIISENNLMQILDTDGPDLFIKTYKDCNKQLWELYKNNEITKQFLSFERFWRPLKVLGCKDKSLAKKISQEYVSHMSCQATLYPETIDILDYLKSKYTIHAITNGFEEIQVKKLKITGLSRYFTQVITSEMADAKKPDPAIYKFSLARTGASVENSLMIGDDPDSDIDGASAAGIDQCWLNPNGTSDAVKATYVIKNLEELKNFL